MSIFTPRKRKKKKTSVGCTYYVMNKKVLPVYRDSGEKIDGESIGIIEPKIVSEKVDISKYVNSFANQCGVENVIKMFKKTGDVKLFAQQNVVDNVDATRLPEKTIEDIYKDVPDSLKGEKDIVSFLKTLSKEQLSAFAKGLKEQALKTKAEKDKESEVSNNEK